MKLVLFADRDLRAPDPGWWPEGLARDIPRAGETIKRGAPVCTLISTGAGVPELVERGSRLLAAASDRGARRWLSSGPSPARAVACCATT